MTDPGTKGFSTVYFLKAELDSSCGNTDDALYDPPPYNGTYRDFIIDDSNSTTKLQCDYGRSEITGSIRKEDLDNPSKLAVIRLISIRTVRGLPWSVQHKSEHEAHAIASTL